MKTVTKFLIIALAAATLAACKKDSEEPSVLSVDRTTIAAEAAGGTYAIAVTSSGAWTATVTPATAAWCTVSPASGTGNGTVTVSVDANATTSIQTATVTVASGELSRTVSVTQTAAAATLSLTPAGQTAIAFAADGTTPDNATFTVTTNQSTWDAVSSQTWCTVVKTATGFTVSAAANTSPVAPAPATVTVTAGEATPIVINVTQAAATTAPFANFTETVAGVSFNMIAAAGGTFTMGGTAEQGSNAQAEEYPTHDVTLSDFYIGRLEVTQALWLAVMGSWIPESNTWDLQIDVFGDNYPVNFVSWNAIVGTAASGDAGYTINGITYYTNGFCYKLSQLAGGGRQFRLPTEAEWEYAARGGAQSEGYKYSGSNTIGDVAWYTENSWYSYENSGYPYRQSVCLTGTKAANELGIYDMSGNVREWCSDWYSADYYSISPSTNPIGPSTAGSVRVCRNGSIIHGSGYCRVSYRGNSAPDSRGVMTGFRLALSPQ